MKRDGGRAQHFSLLLSVGPSIICTWTLLLYHWTYTMIVSSSNRFIEQWKANPPIKFIIPKKIEEKRFESWKNNRSIPKYNSSLCLPFMNVFCECCINFSYVRGCNFGCIAGVTTIKIMVCIILERPLFFFKIFVEIWSKSVVPLLYIIEQCTCYVSIYLRQTLTRNI